MENTRKEYLMERISSLFENEDFCRAYVTCSTNEDLRRVLVEYGVEVSIEEIEEFSQDGLAAIRAAQESQNDELSLDDLEEVAGGGKILAGAVGTACAIGVGALGFFAGVTGAPVLLTVGAFAIGISTVATLSAAAVGRKKKR